MHDTGWLSVRLHWLLYELLIIGNMYMQLARLMYMQNSAKWSCREKHAFYMFHVIHYILHAISCPSALCPHGLHNM